MKLHAIAMSFLLVIAGCTSTNADNVQLFTTEMPVPDNTALVNSGDMRILPLDVLEIKVFNSTGMDGNYQVDPAGKIKMPTLGEVDVKGYTTFELASLLEGGLEERFLRDPQVTVRIAESNGQQFTIEGAIGKPGMYPVRSRISLLQAIALSGGPSPSANLGGVVVFRTIEGQRHAARFDLLKIRNGESVDPIIYGNDLIVIDGQTRNTTLDDFLRGVPLVGMFVALF